MVAGADGAAHAGRDQRLHRRGDARDHDAHPLYRLHLTHLAAALSGRRTLVRWVLLRPAFFGPAFFGPAFFRWAFFRWAFVGWALVRWVGLGFVGLHRVARPAVALLRRRSAGVPA
jgi:hypothetical protein